MTEPAQIVVAALYRFVRLEDYQSLREPVRELMLQHGVRGTLLLAREGINGTIAGSRSGIDAVLDWLRADSRLAAFDVKESHADENPFYRTKVKLKHEIVTMGVPDIDPARSAGRYVDPQDWNALINDPEVLLIDTRNQYEVEIGSFQGAINPATTTFREFPAYVKQHLDPRRHKKVAMFCTGGIRCEKSTAYLREQGFEEVYHLQGGILNYLEKVPESESMWQGECFVFDNRVTVNHRLQPGEFDQCHACRRPISEADKASDQFEQGISCPRCFDERSPGERRRFVHRQRQIRLASARGERHIGDPMSEIIRRRRAEKLQKKAHQRAAAPEGTEL